MKLFSYLSRSSRRLAVRILAVVVAFLCFSQQALATGVIRDAELETVIRRISDPIFNAAGLEPSSIRMFILNDNSINAFVYGGQNIFIHTGLIQKSTTPDILEGVIAHETGHIAGGHLSKGADAAKGAMATTALGYALGLAAMLAGSADAGSAITASSAQIAQRQYLKFSRTQEQSADQAALTYLDRIGNSAEGLADLLQMLYSQQAGDFDRINPYTQSHPLSQDRLTLVKHHLEESPYRNHKIGPPLSDDFHRAVVKLDAFLEPVSSTLRDFPKENTSVEARYARAIAYYRIPDLPAALKEIDSLIKEFPKNPFYVELKGQILFENGKVMEALPYYEKSVELLPNNALMRLQLGTALVGTEADEYLDKAIFTLTQGLHGEPENGFGWRQLGIAYGRKGDLGQSYLALAESSLLSGELDEAKDFAARAKENLQEGSPAAIRLKDIENRIEQQEKEKKKLLS